MASALVNPAEPVDYSSTAVPSSYTCGDCGKTGVKLWRDYQTFLNHQSLRCADCAAAKESIDISQMRPDGTRPDKYGDTDNIGWLVPAVPTQDNDTFWGYTSVPQDGCDWWNRLPIR